MALSARSAGKPRRLNVSPTSEDGPLGRVLPVCNFVNAEVARLRNTSIAIAAACALGAILLPLLTGIGDPLIPLVLAAGVFTFWFVRARSQLKSSCTNIAAKRLIAALSKDLTYKRASALTQQQFAATDLFSGRIVQWNS